MNIFLNHSLGIDFLKSKKNIKNFHQFIYENFDRMDNSSKEYVELFKILLAKKIAPTQSWINNQIGFEKTGRKSPLQKWWFEKGFFENIWIFKNEQDIFNYLTNQVLPYLVEEPRCFSMFLKKLKSNNADLLEKIKDPKNVSKILFFSLVFYKHHYKKNKIEEIINLLVQQDFIPTLRIKLSELMLVPGNMITKKELSWPMVFAVRREKCLFDFFVESSEMKVLLYEDIQKNAQLLLDAPLFPIPLAPHLVSAGFDFSLRNEKNQNIFHVLFKNANFVLSKNLHELMKKNASRFLFEKDLEGQTCFDVIENCHNQELKTTLKGLGKIHIKDYKALIEKAALEKALEKKLSAPVPPKKRL